jgi:peptidyl-prolyl cis-trans isomerase C
MVHDIKRLLGVAAGAVAVSLFVFTASCGRTKPLHEKELVRINNRVITLEEFERDIDQLPPPLKTLIITDKGRREFLQRLIERELLLQEGAKKGLDKDDEILSKVEQFKQNLIIESLAEKLCAGKDEVSDKEVETYYRENKKKFFVEERVRVRHIMVKTMAEAQEIKRRLDQGDDFITLAKQYSIWPSKQNGGDLGYITKGMVDKSFEEAAFSLKRRGELSGIVETKLGFHIIRLEDRQMPRELTFPEVQEQIKKFLRDNKRREILAAHLKELQGEAQVSINEKLLATEGKQGS